MADEIDLLYDNDAFGAESFEDLPAAATSATSKGPEVKLDLSHTELYTDDKRAASSRASSHATNALYVCDLQWWTTDKELVGLIEKAGSGKHLNILTFLEHRINGKSRGVAYLEFADESSASKAKDYLEKSKIEGNFPLVHFADKTQIGQNPPFRNLPLLDSRGNQIAISADTTSRPTSSLQERKETNGRSTGEKRHTSQSDDYHHGDRYKRRA